MIGQVLKRSALVFLALTGAVAVVVGVVAWRHVRAVGGCPPQGVQQAAVTCYSSTVFFWGWADLVAFVGVGIAASVALAWLLAKRAWRRRAG